MVLRTRILAHRTELTTQLEKAVAGDAALDDAPACESEGDLDRETRDERTVPQDLDAGLARHGPQE